MDDNNEPSKQNLSTKPVPMPKELRSVETPKIYTHTSVIENGKAVVNLSNVEEEVKKKYGHYTVDSLNNLQQIPGLSSQAISGLETLKSFY